MATWQAHFRIVPSGSFPAGYRAALDEVAPRYTSWSPDILAWGEENGHRIEVLHEAGEPVEASFRVDLRAPDAVFIRTVLAFVRSAGFGLEDELGRVVGPNETELVRALRGSRAFRFTEDPELYLRRVELGGLDDA